MHLVQMTSTTTKTGAGSTRASWRWRASGSTSPSSTAVRFCFCLCVWCTNDRRACMCMCVCVIQSPVPTHPHPSTSLPNTPTEQHGPHRINNRRQGRASHCGGRARGLLAPRRPGGRGQGEGAAGEAGDQAAGGDRGACFWGVGAGGVAWVRDLCALPPSVHPLTRPRMTTQNTKTQNTNTHRAWRSGCRARHSSPRRRRSWWPRRSSRWRRRRSSSRPSSGAWRSWGLEEWFDLVLD